MEGFSQYSSLFVVYLFLILLVPAVILNLLKVKVKYGGMLVSVPMLILLFGTQGTEGKIFLIFLIYEMTLIWGYYFISKRTTSEFIYFIVLTGSVLPIIVVKGCVYTSYNYLGFTGISYISFRIWQLIIGIHDRRVDKLTFLDVLYFVTFFPTLSSGPVDRFQRFKDDLDKRVPCKEYLSCYLLPGLRKIGLGVVYKFGIAFLIHHYIISALPETRTIKSVFIYMYAYTIYLFFDFAGYSNMAIGNSYILGIKVGENFNKPFLARNMKEFWERWHISLSSWFGDYVFKRFVLNNMRNGLFKNKKIAARWGNIVTMLLMGVWHGPYLFYVVYGLYEGVALVLTDIYLRSSFYKKLKQKLYYDIVSRVVCFQVIAFGMLLFSGYLFSI